jgi:hypothetical protein
MPWVKADVGFASIQGLKITRRLGDCSGESAEHFAGRGDSGRALHPSDEFPQMVSFERWSTGPVHGAIRLFTKIWWGSAFCQ